MADMADMADYADTIADALQSLWPFVASFAIGLLIGLERRQAGAALGARAFTLIALFGTLCALLGEASGNGVVMAAGLAAACSAAALASLRRPTALAAATLVHPSGTAGAAATLVAAGWCFALGAIVWYGYTEVALVLAVASSAMLRMTPVVPAASARLGSADVAGALQSALIALAILPIAPDQELGPYGVINPYFIWLLTVSAGTIAWIAFAIGELHTGRLSAILRGLLGGAISAALTTRACAQASASDPGAAGTYAATVGAAVIASLARVALLTSVAAPKFQSAAALVWAAATLCGLPFVMWRVHTGRPAGTGLPFGYRNPAGLRVLAGYAAAFALAMMAVAWLSERLGSPVVYAPLFYAPLALFGLVAGEPLSLAGLRLGSVGATGEREAIIGMGCALGASALFKLVLAFRSGGPRFGRLCAPAVLASVGGIVIGVLLALARLADER